MEEVWVVYLCLFLLVLILILRKQNPDLEAVKKEKESKSSPPPTTYYPSTPGKHLEYSEEEMEKSFEKLTSILFDSEARKREGHHEQKSHHHHRTADAETKDLTGKGPGQSQYQSSQHRVQVWCKACEECQGQHCMKILNDLLSPGEMYLGVHGGEGNVSTGGVYV